VREHLIGMRIAKTVVFAVTFALAISAAGPERPLTKTELKRLITNAQSKTDHERIAQYFEAEAASYEADAKDHADLAQFYNKEGKSGPGFIEPPGKPARIRTLRRSFQEPAKSCRTSPQPGSGAPRNGPRGEKMMTARFVDVISSTRL